MKKILLLSVCFSFTISFHSYCQERTDEVRQKLSLSVEGQSAKISNVTGWSKMENQDGKFWKKSEYKENESYIPGCPDAEYFEYLQMFKIKIEGQIFYLLCQGGSRIYAFKSSSLDNLKNIITKADGKTYFAPNIDYCTLISKKDKQLAVIDVENVIKDKEMIRSLLIGEGENPCKGYTVFEINSQVLKGENIVRFCLLPSEFRQFVAQNEKAFYSLNENYFEIKKSDFEKLFEFSPYQSEVGAFNLGNEKLQSKDYEGAISAFNTCIKMNPNKYEYYYGRGFAYQNSNHLKEAHEDYTKALSMIDYETYGNFEQTASDIFSYRADVLFANGQYAGAIDDLTQAKKYGRIENRNGYYNRIGQAYFYQNKFTQALIAYANGIQGYSRDGLLRKMDLKFLLSPNNTSFNNKAELISSLNGYSYSMYQLADSVVVLNRLNQIVRGSEDEYIGVGYPAVIICSTKLIELDPKFIDGYYVRGLAKIKLNQKDSGCADLQKAEELGHNEIYQKAISTYCK